MGKDHTPHTFSRPSGYESDLEISEKNAYKVNTSFGSSNHNSYAMNRDGTHEHYYYDPQTQKMGWHGANFPTRNNHPKQTTPSTQNEVACTGKETSSMDIYTQRIDMRPETQTEIKDKYATAVNDAAGFTKTMIQQLSEKSEILHSVKLKFAINYFIKFYNDSLKGIVQLAAHEWTESEASVCKVLIATGNDDDEALNEGREFENKLYETASSMFSERFEELSHSTAGGFFGAQDMQACADIVQKVLNNFDELVVEVKDEFETGAEDNAIYSAVGSLVLDTLKVVFAAFGEAQEQFNRLCEDLGVIIPKRNEIGRNRTIDILNRTDPLAGTYDQIGLDR